MLVRVVQPLNAVAAELIPSATHSVACAPIAAIWAAIDAVKFAPNPTIWGRVWTVEFKLDGLLSWLKICSTLWICVFILLIKAENCCGITVVVQVNIAKGAEKKNPKPLFLLLLLLLLMHAVKLDIACWVAFCILIETFMRIMLLLRIVSFRMETPALNSATVKKKAENC